MHKTDGRRLPWSGIPNLLWFSYASVWYVDIDTKTSVGSPSALSVGKTQVDVDIDPWVYMVSVSYKF